MTAPLSAAIPVRMRVHLAHAVVQSLADTCGADILHIKGPAVDPSLLPRRSVVDDAGQPTEAPLPRASTDADVLVRPAHVKSLFAACESHGWRVVTRFTTGSAFEHASTLWHEQLGYLDLHRHFPGVRLEAAEAFDVLWADRTVTLIAHRRCHVPSVEAQRLLLVLHGARSGAEHNPDLMRIWGEADPAAQAQLRAQASRLQAEVAFAAATGDLDAFADDPTYALWKHFSHWGNADRLAEWKARIQAQPTLRGRARVLAQLFVVNTDHLAMGLGRPPTRRELAQEYARRAWAGTTGLARALGHQARVLRQRRSNPGGDR